MQRRALLALALTIAISALPQGASAQDSETPRQGARSAGPFKVVTTFTVLADMARNVAGDVAVVESITKPGAEIHGYEPTPGDLVRAQGADLILYNGLNLELWFQQFLDNLDNVPSAVISEGVVPIPIILGAGQKKPNPHGWMALDSALIYVDNIAAAMGEHDPANAATYAANAAAYKDRIRAALGPLRDTARALPADRRWLVTSEGAFSYLARDFGLQELYLWPVNADAQGTPQQVRHVIDQMREHSVGAIFSESTVSDRPARRIAAETGAGYSGVLYVDSLSRADGPVPTYLDLLRVTAETIIAGLKNG